MKWLETQPTFTLHRAVKRKFPTRSYKTSGPSYQWQADLVDLQQFKKQNKGYSYILTCIDVFSRLANAIPLKSKAYVDVVNGFKNIFAKYPLPPPHLVQTDQGSEFENRNIQKFFKEHGIKQFSVMSPYKAALVERFNRTLRGRMFRYFTKNGTRKWHDVLQKLIDGYNNTKHSSLHGFTPNQVHYHKEISAEIWEKQNETNKMPKSSPNNSVLKIGDFVRLANVKKTFEHGYTPNWTEEIFIIDNIDKSQLPVMYSVKDMDGEVIQGKFYKPELQRVSNVFRIEKILKTKLDSNKQLMYYVKWMGYKNPSWVRAEDII